LARRSEKSDRALILLGLIAGAIYLLIKILLFIWPLILLVAIIYFYINWQNKKLPEYNNNWKLFYKKELKNKLKITAIVFPVSLIIGYSIYSSNESQKSLKLEKQKIETEQLRIKQEKIRLALQFKKDSSQVYLELALKDFKKKRYKRVLVNLDSSLKIYPENHEALFNKGLTLVRRRKYEDAINIFNTLNNKTDEYKSDALLEKGRCFLKLRKKKEAAIQIFQSAKLGNPQAEKLYNKVNPMIKEIIGYVTRCCDGTTSSAKGRGACSHHGGVCNWNDPIYRERRKYEIEYNF